MAALTVGNWRIADATGPPQRRECSGLVAAHLQWHLERGLRSLPLVDRSGDGAVEGPIEGPVEGTVDSVSEAP
jgi:DNA repair protein RecO (recombination protein O)